MKLKIAIIAVAVVAVAVAGLYFSFRQSPIKKIVYQVLAGNYPIEKKAELTPELRAFVDWYEPMVKDASEQVLEVMKRFDPKYRSSSAQRNKKLETVVPTDEWIERILKMNIKIEDYDDYTAYLSGRWDIYRAIKDPAELADLKDWYGLADSASWDEVLEADIRMSEKLHTLIEQAQAKDWRVQSGSLGKEGVFIPNRLATIYVQPGTISAGTGVPEGLLHEIGKWQAGVAPKPKIPFYIDVIYLNEKGQPIKR